jgi:hypothetical protein
MCLVYCKEGTTTTLLLDTITGEARLGSRLEFQRQRYDRHDGSR